ncbi:Uncharacterised protein [Mycobacteroides abscessus subsp. massiliense]|nr:Uncharacterised protein [Mycobacteroides abscessus subsp. massiliense]
MRTVPIPLVTGVRRAGTATARGERVSPQLALHFCNPRLNRGCTAHRRSLRVLSAQIEPGRGRLLPEGALPTEFTDFLCRLVCDRRDRPVVVADLSEDVSDITRNHGGVFGILTSCANQAIGFFVNRAVPFLGDHSRLQPGLVALHFLSLGVEQAVKRCPMCLFGYPRCDVSFFGIEPRNDRQRNGIRGLRH